MPSRATPGSKHTNGSWRDDLPFLDDEALATWRADVERIYALADEDCPGNPDVAANSRDVAAVILEGIKAEQEKRRRAGYRRAPLATRGGIPRHSIADVKARVDLAWLCEHFGISLDRAGDHLVGICPFHAERTPSFHVYPEPEDPHFHCFGCGVHGDAITLVDHFAGGCGVASAVDALASIVGVAPPSDRPTRPILRLAPKAARHA